MSRRLQNSRYGLAKMPVAATMAKVRLKSIFILGFAEKKDGTLGRSGMVGR
jgi:hypothetical protein